MDTLLCLHSTALSTAASAPDWVQLIPAGTFTGADGRGPYIVEDMDAIIATSMRPGQKLPIDENHSTDIRGENGDPSPARGWIVAMEARDDGVWGQVEWTGSGRALLEDRAYAYISPVFLASENKPHRVTQILRASLVNDPNLTMKSLHKKGDGPMDEAIAKALGLKPDADLAAATAAISGLQATLASMRKALALDDDADSEAVITALNARLKAKPEESGKDEVIAGLEKQITSLNARLTSLTETTAKKSAIDVVDAAIAARKLVPSLRDHYISRHMKDPDGVAKELDAFVSINAGGIVKPPVETEAGAIDAAGQEVIALMGLDHEAYAKTHKQIMKEYG
ncbi:phage protease [Oceaniradius stylonematis]|uniref:phage protease n=1 Tax=Oceaniradius stylonematis TaxID=2184161 RepID=UPI00273DB90C|nr:phage protease [Oceaniradius stylonematis]